MKRCNARRLRMGSMTVAAIAFVALAWAGAVAGAQSGSEGLAARAPYFHNGIATTLEDVVRHYEDFLGFVFTDQEREDLVAFLNAI